MNPLVQTRCLHSWRLICKEASSHEHPAAVFFHLENPFVSQRGNAFHSRNHSYKNFSQHARCSSILFLRLLKASKRGPFIIHLFPMALHLEKHSTSLGISLISFPFSFLFSLLLSPSASKRSFTLAGSRSFHVGSPKSETRL